MDFPGMRLVSDIKHALQYRYMQIQRRASQLYNHLAFVDP